MNKCLGKDRNKDLCRNNQLNETNFCKFHQYMNNYTDEMLNKLTLCSGCKKMYYITEGRQCEKCNKRGEQNRIKNKNKVIVCIKEGCMFKKSKENEYCGKHQQEYFKKQTELEGKKVCTNYIRGCRTKLEKNDIYSRCLICRKKDDSQTNYEIIKKNNQIEDEIILCEEPVKNTGNNKIYIMEDINDKNKIDNDNSMNNNSINNYEIQPFDSLKTIIYVDESYKPTVGKNIASINRTYLVPEYIVGSTKLLYDIITEFDNMGMDFPLANTLMTYDYKVNKIIKYIDATKKDGKFNLDNLKKCTNEKCKKEMPEHAYIDKFNRIVNQCIVCRSHIQIKSNRQTRINSKALWKEKNPEKVAKYFLDGRGRQIEKKGIEKYLEDNAKNAKTWRYNNPEKCLEANEKKKCNIKIHYDNYIRDANKKNLEFELTFDEFREIVKQPCFYCNIIQEEKGFNGIDKMNYGGNYVKENSVSCCEMCNVMKGTLTSEIFLKRIEHILTFQGYINGKLYPEYFANHMSSNYKCYKKRATDKNLDFEISEENFYSLIMENCYICGKKSEGDHINGVDRIDNDNGYIYNNIESCCGECNYMKNKFNLQDFFDKLRKIKKYKLKEFEIINSRFSYQNKINRQTFLNKKSPAELKEYYKNNMEKYKQKNSEKLKIYEREKKRKQREKNKVIIDENLNDNKSKDTEINNNESIDNKNENNKGKQYHLNKKTPEQLKEEARIRKQKQRDKLKEKYGDEEYKKKRALELAEYRKKKQE